MNAVLNAQDALKHFRCQRWKYLFLWAFIIGILCGGIGFLIAAFESSPDSTMKELGQSNGGYQDGDWTKYAVAPIKTMFGSVEWSPDTITASYMAICGGIGFVVGFGSTICGQLYRWRAWDWLGSPTGSRFNKRYTSAKLHYSGKKHSDYFNWKWTWSTFFVIVCAMVGFGLKGYYADGSLVGAGLNAGFASLGCLCLMAVFWGCVRWNAFGLAERSSKKKGKDPQYHTRECMLKGKDGECTCEFGDGKRSSSQYREKLRRYEEDNDAIRYCECGKRLTITPCPPYTKNAVCVSCGTRDNHQDHKRNAITDRFNNDSSGQSKPTSDTPVYFYEYDNRGQTIPLDPSTARPRNGCADRLGFAIPIEHPN